MAFLRPLSPQGAPPPIRGERLVLRYPTIADFPQWAELRGASRRFLEPWEPVWTSDELTRLGFRRRLKRYQREMREGSGYPFFLFSTDESTLLGGLTLSHIQRGVTQSASVGYWIGERHARRGYMTDALNATIAFAFHTLRLHGLDPAS